MRRAIWACLLALALACSGRKKEPVPAVPPPAVEPVDPASLSARERKMIPPEGTVPFVAQADPCLAWSRPGTFEFPLSFDGTDTTALVHVPPGAGPRRVVFVLHGGDGTGAHILRQTEILPISDREGFVVVAPTGQLNTDMDAFKWNSGSFPGRDDVKYLDALAVAVEAATCADKVLAIGFSNGAQMANRWLCEGSEVDAIVSAAGTLKIAPEQCTSRQSPVLAYVGTEDNIYRAAPAQGGLSAADTVEKFWAPHNGCTSRFQQVVHGDTTCHEYASCEAPTVLCVIDGFPHGYPHGPSEPKGCDTHASEEGWRWFREVVP